MRAAVSRLGGSSRLEGDIATRTVSVEYEPSLVGVDAIQEALRGVGYESTVIS